MTECKKVYEDKFKLEPSINQYEKTVFSLKLSNFCLHFAPYLISNLLISRGSLSSASSQISLHLQIAKTTRSRMEDELKAITSTLLSFFNFHKWLYEHAVKPKSIKYSSLTPEEKELLSFYPALIRDLGQCIDFNRSFLQELALEMAQEWGVSSDPSDWAPSLPAEFDKVRSTLLQMSREWTDDGSEERDITFGRIIRAACQRYPNQGERQNTRVLIPGCGLGRLVYEFVSQGFATQGNEINYHMLLALGFIMNHVTIANGHSFFPYIHTSSHVLRRLFQIRPVSVPDVSPVAEFSKDAAAWNLLQLMSVAAGSFVDLYGPADLTLSEAFTSDPSAVEFRQQNKGAFDIVATCFFLDTAHNIIDYLKTIYNCLKDDGVWINMGPTHWHFEGDQTQQMETRMSERGEPELVLTTMQGMELARDELFDLMKALGFEIIEAESGIKTSYSSDVRATSKFVYDCEFWVAKKVQTE